MVHITKKVTAITNTNSAKETLINMAASLEASNPNYILEKEDSKMDRFINYIHTFKIEITNWEGNFKLSQDKNKQDQENAKQELIKKSSSDRTGFINEIYL